MSGPTATARSNPREPEIEVSGKERSHVHVHPERVLRSGSRASSLLLAPRLRCAARWKNTPTNIGRGACGAAPPLGRLSASIMHEVNGPLTYMNIPGATLSTASPRKNR